MFDSVGLYWLMNTAGSDRGIGTGRDISDSNLLTGDGNSNSNVNVYNEYYPHGTPTLEKRVERLERATFGDDQIGLYGVIRQQQTQTRWLQLLTVAVLLSEAVRYLFG